MKKTQSPLHKTLLKKRYFLFKFEFMKLKNKLRNSLVRKIQHLSTDKLTEVSNLLNKIEDQIKSKETTLKFAGLWKDIDINIFQDFTENLHENRTNDRQIP
jgi:hypothetical protein